MPAHRFDHELESDLHYDASLYTQHRGHIALCLLDVALPGMSGRELFQRLREHNPRVNAALFSGHDFDDANAPDALPLVRKPIGYVDLLRTVRNLIDLT